MSRRQSVPLNMFLRQADPMPPLFPAPNEGDFYYNITFHVVRIYRMVEDSDPPRYAWQDLTTGGAEQVNKDTTWSFITPYDPGDPSNIDNPEGRSSTPIWIDTDAGIDESGGDGGGSSALDSTWTIVGSTNPGDPSNLPNPNGRKNTPLWIDTSVGGTSAGVGFMGSMGWRQYHWIDDPVDYDLVPPPGYAWSGNKEHKFSRYDLDGNDNVFFFGQLDRGDTVLMEYGSNWDDGDIGRCDVTYCRDASEDGYITLELNDETYYNWTGPYPEGILRVGIYPNRGYPFQVLPPGGTEGQVLKIVGGKPTWTT